MSRLADFISPRLPTEQDVYDVITGAHTDVAEDWVKGEIWRDVNGQLVPVALPHTLTPDDPSDITQFLDGVSVDHNESRDVMREATFHLEEYPGLGDFNTLTDLMRLYHCFNDVNGEMILKIPVGVFCFMLPDRTLDPAGNSWDITGYDLAWRIQILGFDTVYTVPQGVKVTDAMKIMLMADKLPPSEGGRQPAGVPTAGSTQSTLPVYSGGSPAYTSVGVSCTSLGTLDAQGFIVMPNGLRYNPYSGAQVDPVTYAPIDPLTLVPMIQVKTVAGVLVPNTFYSSGFTRAWYQTALGCFISPYDVNAAPIQASTNPIFILDIYKNVQLLRTTQTAMQSPYKSPVYLSGLPCPLATWPYDYDHSGPYFGDQMIQPVPSTGGTGGSTGGTSGGTGGSTTIPGSPPDTSSGVHAFAVSSAQYSSMLTSTPHIEAVWDWNNSNASTYPTVWKGYYFPCDRQPVHGGTVQTLAWFQANHPDWIMYRSDRTTVAYAFGSTNVIPLDVSNPACMAWLQDNFYHPTLATGLYQHADVDNFGMTNGGSWSGLRAGHYDLTGTWVQQYNATNDDPAYRAYMIQLAATWKTWMTTAFPGIAFCANFSYTDSFPTDSDSLMSHMDVMMDEQGMTRGNNAPPFKYMDSLWLHKVQHMTTFLNRGAGWMDINQCADPFASLTTDEKLWALGNYLILKNNASWIWTGGEQEYDKNNVMGEYAAAAVATPVGSYYASQGAYRRDFLNGVVYVNPSSTTSYTVTMPAGVYHDLYGVLIGATVTLPPASARVYVKSAAGAQLMGSGPVPAGSGAGYCPSGYAVADPRSGCHYVTVTWPGGVQVTGYFTGVVNGQVGPGTIHYNPSIGTKVDPVTGMPIDPNTCAAMTMGTFSSVSGGSYQAPACANGAIYDTMLGCFYIAQPYSAPGIYSEITYVDPKTLIALSPQPEQDKIGSFACNALIALGGDGGVGTQSGTTGTVTPTSTGTAVPWPDANNPGLTPAGCDFFGPGLDASRIKIPDSDLLTPGPMKFDDKMGFIAAWNSLAGLINYYPLGFDSNGNAVSGPVPWQYTDAQGNAYIPTEVDWTYGSDAAGTMKTPIKVRINDMTALANMVKLKVQSNKGAAPIYVRKLNRSPNSMMAIQNLGYVLPKTIQNDKIVDLQVAIDTVEVELEYASLAEQAVDFSGPIIPLHDLHWLVYINYYGTDGTLEIDYINNPYPFSEGAWKIDFANEDHEHQVGRRVGI